MVLVLTESERLALSELLKQRIDDFNSEINHVSDVQLKRALRRRRHLLSDIMRRMQLRCVMA